MNLDDVTLLPFSQRLCVKQCVRLPPPSASQPTSPTPAPPDQAPCLFLVLACQATHERRGREPDKVEKRWMQLSGCGNVIIGLCSRGTVAITEEGSTVGVI
ncbi:hypothetical protein E2C01_029302 [Portunus trituberculatus]|uniref:Uncharacterized protein n=1 Tax=Portunus trituberculatus TaxID=210409 RepID=A0A5B7ER45_PORTR|nr:hypothetical protein [Portunus trituberculatus]